MANLDLYKIPAINTSLPGTIDNPADVTSANITSNSVASTSIGISEQQVRDIVGQRISTGLTEDKVREIVNDVTRTTSKLAMTESKVREIVNGMQKFLTGQNVMMDGIQRSQSYIPEVQGWQIDAEGNVEFNNGIFRGDVVLGGTIRTVDTAEEIQPAIDEVSADGGGTIYLAPGTYFPTTNIDIPSYVYLIGAARDAVIIDFGAAAHSIRSIGTSGTHNLDIAIINITVQNSSSYGFYATYLDNSKLDGLNVYSCSYGVYLDHCTAVGTVGDGGFLDLNGTGMKMVSCSACSIYFTTFSNSTSGHGLEMNTCTNMTLIDSEISTNFADGINLVSCSNIGFVSLSVHNNGGQGIELVSGCNDLQFSHTLVDSNTSDGMKLTATSDRNTVVAMTFSNNGGWGVNIAASTCDNNQIIAPAFDSNSSGTINDLGTNTFISPQIFAPYFQQSVALYATGTIPSAIAGMGSNTDGSVVICFLRGVGVARFLKDTTNGTFVLTHKVTSLVDLTLSYVGVVVVGSFVYAFYDNGANAGCYRYALADLTGEQSITFGTAIVTAGTSALTAWTNGTNFYVISDDATTTVRILTVSGTAFTETGTATAATANLIGSRNVSFWDGTTAYVSSSANAGGAQTVYKLTTIDASTVSATTVIPIGTVFSDSDYSSNNVLGIININSTRMYIGNAATIYNATAAISFELNLLPVIKP